MGTTRRSLLSSQARIQVPWIKVTIGSYTFGVFSQTTREKAKDNQGFYTEYNVQYPNYINSLSITKINGQVNQYSLSLQYPVRDTDDPNFFEKVFSSVSTTRKIIFSYGDASMPTYCYKDEEAIITGINKSFNFGNSGNTSSVIGYTITAISSATLGLSGTYTFINGKNNLRKPSTIIKEMFKNKDYGLQNIFTGMTVADLDYFIDGHDKEVELESKQNISALDYLTYLVSCMIPEGTPTNSVSKDIYILTLHDDTTYDKAFQENRIINNKEISGPYFLVTRTSYGQEHADAYEIDLGYNTSTIVTNFQVNDQQNYSLYYDYQTELNGNDTYVRRLNDKGQWEDIYAPSISSKNDKFKTRPEDVTWWTKITKYPISASITVLGLLRPATLMQYLRLNVIFPGGHKHISSGLYIVTKQQDQIDSNGYKTTLSLTRIDGDNSLN